MLRHHKTSDHEDTKHEGTKAVTVCSFVSFVSFCGRQLT